MTDLSTTYAKLDLVTKYAVKYSLDPALVCAVIEQESNWNPWAIRFEPAFYERYIAGKVTNTTEAHAQSTSWGLCQVMGATARESGFKGTYLSELCDLDTGVDVGCAVLQHKLDLALGDVHKGLLLWNGGGNPSYPDQVLARMSTYQTGGNP